MVILSLFIGVILGAILVVFVVQNTAIVAVSFLTWNLTASLSLVLLGTMLGGVLIALLILLPSLILDEVRNRALRRRVLELESAVAHKEVPPAPQTTETTV